MVTPQTFVGVDIGGTRMSVGLVSSAGEVRALHRLETPRSAGAEACLGELLAAVRALVAQAPSDERLVAVGVGFGGPVDAAAGEVRRSHHVAGWSGAPLVERLAEATGLPAFLENDANAGALAEARFGAGRGHDPLPYVNVGTGIGGGIVLGGRIHQGAHFNAAEIGHLVLLPDGPACPCGRRGCVEALASGDALGRRARKLQAAGELSESPLAQVSNLTGRVVGEYAAGGDEAAVRIVADAGGYLGWALALASNLVDPELILVGGGVAALGDLYLGPARARFRDLVMDLLAGVPILTAALGYDAGVIGAAAVAMVAVNT